MILNAGNILLIGSILLFTSIIAGKAGFKFGVPALLLFLGVGMLFGNDGLGIQFNNPEIAQFSSRNIVLRDGHITEDSINPNVASAKEALAALPKETD